MNGKTEACAELLEFPDARLRVVAEVEVPAFMQAAHAQDPDQNLPHKLLRGQPSQCRVKGQTTTASMPAAASSFTRSSIGVSSRGARAGRRNRSG